MRVLPAGNERNRQPTNAIRGRGETMAAFISPPHIPVEERSWPGCLLFEPEADMSGSRSATGYRGQISLYGDRASTSTYFLFQINCTFCRIR
ncbi:hypothetical protein Q5P01_001381 [Channa striata]|uniref:Uncharacterized protein n=1 Tax=Channa striata TaxID=64152 RepID=A0AA88NYS3_CHASR|nr:hypothetical protein Q5P01_001381 [Channa striata]